MSAGAPWSVKGINPKAREVAKDLARRSGMTLGEWLNHVILEDDLPDDVAVQTDLAERIRRAAPTPPTPPRLRAVPSFGQGDDLARVADALDRLTDRIEASETRTGLAIHGVEQSVRQALGRIDSTEQEQVAFTRRIERLEAGPRSPEALKALEARIAKVEAERDVVITAVLQKLGERIAAAEARTAGALDELRSSLGALDDRLGAVERGGAQDTEARFEDLAQTLTERVEAARAEIAERLAGAAGGEVEARLAEMAEHVRVAESRAARAVEEIGRQVLNMAEAVSRRLVEVDTRSAEAIDQVGGEVARIAGAVEMRLARAEHTQAEAFERLGRELARVSDRLAERPTADDPRGAGWAMERAPEAAPIVADEPPPEDLLAAARQRLDAALEPAADDIPDNGPLAPFGPELFARAEPETEARTAEPPAFAPESFTPLSENDEDIFEAEVREPEAEARPLSTREVIEQARAAARAKAEGPRARPAEMRARVDARAATGRLFEGFGGRPKPRRQNSAMQTALMIAGGAAFLSVGAAGLTLMQGPQAGPGEGGAPRAAMALTPSAAGAARPSPESFEAIRANLEAGEAGALARLQALAGEGHPQAQLLLAQLYETGEAGLPQDMVEARRWTARAAEAGEPKAMHNLGVYYFRGDGGTQDLATAAQWFRKAAAQGLVESQYNLGLLYQSGSGVKKDLAEARRWFLRAAARGDAQAKAAADALGPKTAVVRPAPAAAPAGPTPKTQAILARLGYYDGPIDGRDTPAYRAALAAYQRDASSPQR